MPAVERRAGMDGPVKPDHDALSWTSRTIPALATLGRDDASSNVHRPLFALVQARVRARWIFGSSMVGMV
jgi:hypothetical protein